MTSTLAMGAHPPSYMDKTSSSAIFFRSFWGALRAGRGFFTGGDLSQVGGDFVLQSRGGNVEATWCKRMRNTRDHAEPFEIKRALGMEDDDASSTDDMLEKEKKAQKTNRRNSFVPQKLKRWSTVGVNVNSGITRRLSKKNAPGNGNKRSSWHPTNPNPYPNDGKGNGGIDAANGKPPSPGAVKEAEQERRVLEQLKEEGGAESNDAPAPAPASDGDTEHALAKLTGQEPVTKAEQTQSADAEAEAVAERPAADATQTEQKFVDTEPAPKKSVPDAVEKAVDISASELLPATTEYQNQGPAVVAAAA